LVRPISSPRFHAAEIRADRSNEADDFPRLGWQGGFLATQIDFAAFLVLPPGRAWPLEKVGEWRFRSGIGFVCRHRIEAIGRYLLKDNELRLGSWVRSVVSCRLPVPSRSSLSNPIPPRRAAPRGDFPHGRLTRSMILTGPALASLAAAIFQRTYLKSLCSRDLLLSKIGFDLPLFATPALPLESRLFPGHWLLFTRHSPLAHVHRPLATILLPLAARHSPLLTARRRPKIGFVLLLDSALVRSKSQRIND
jgi:hypothetical protein